MHHNNSSKLLRLQSDFHSDWWFYFEQIYHNIQLYLSFFIISELFLSLTNKQFLFHSTLSNLDSVCFPITFKPLIRLVLWSHVIPHLRKRRLQYGEHWLCHDFLCRNAPYNCILVHVNYREVLSFFMTKTLHEEFWRNRRAVSNAEGYNLFCFHRIPRIDALVYFESTVADKAHTK